MSDSNTPIGRRAFFGAAAATVAAIGLEGILSASTANSWSTAKDSLGKFVVNEQGEIADVPENRSTEIERVSLDPSLIQTASI